MDQDFEMEATSPYDPRCTATMDSWSGPSLEAAHRLVVGIKPVGVIPDAVPLLDLDILAVGICNVLGRDALDVVSVEVDGLRGNA